MSDNDFAILHTCARCQQTVELVDTPRSDDYQVTEEHLYSVREGHSNGRCKDSNNPIISCPKCEARNIQLSPMTSVPPGVFTVPLHNNDSKVSCELSGKVVVECNACAEFVLGEMISQGRDYIAKKHEHPSSVNKSFTLPCLGSGLTPPELVSSEFDHKDLPPF